MRYYLSHIFSLILLISALTPAHAARHAVVIGNGDYNKKVPSLDNPVNDANDMAAVLKSLGFDVILKLNASKKTMKNAVREFGQRLQSGDVALFYYSGHGLQSNNRNYLVPPEADIRNKKDIEFESFDVSYVLQKMERVNREGVNLVILDACRDNPFQSNIKNLKKGLAEIKGDMGFLIAYATAPDMPSYGNSKKRNSIYTAYLLSALRDKKKVSMSVLDLLTEVTKQVVAETQKAQVPWYSTSLTERFCFVDGHCCSECPQMLRVCERHFQAYRLTTGAGGTAFSCYKAVLEKEPSNTEALAGLAKIERRYVRWIEAALSKGKIDKAKQYLEGLGRVNPESPKYAALEEKIYPKPLPPLETPVTPSQVSPSVETPSPSNSSNLGPQRVAVWQAIVAAVIMIWLASSLKQLSPWNPLDYFRLLWWILVMPQLLKAYRETFGENDEKRVGKWLLSTLILLPFLVPTLALGLEFLPPFEKAWQPDTYLWISALLVGGWLLTGWLVLTGWLGDIDEILNLAGFVAFGVGVALGVQFGVAFGVAFGVLYLLRFVMVACFVAFCVPFCVAFGVAFGVVGLLAVVLTVLLTFGVVGLVRLVMVAGVVNGVLFAVGTGGFMAYVTGGVLTVDVAANIVKKSLKTGTPSLLARLAFLLLLAAHLFLIWFSFLGGWRQFA